MKKLLSLLLAAVLALGLSVSALAYEDTDPPQWQQWGYDSLEEYLADWNETEEEYYDEIAGTVAREKAYPAWKAAYLAAHPDYTAELLAEDDPPLWQWWEYESKEDFEADVCEDGQSYEDWLTEWYLEDVFWDAWYAARYAEQIAEEKAELGLVYDVNVMLGGKALAFSDAAPEIANGRTMVPLRAVMEELGAAVDFDDAAKTASIVRDGKTLSFVLGSDRFTVAENGETGELVLDSVPYIKNDRIYVPIRFVGDALGYEVLWSDTYRTAVLIDKEAAVEEFNKNFTVLNAVLAMGSDLDRTQTYKGESKLDLKVTLFDSINGDKTYAGSVSAAVVQNGTAAQGTVRYDVGDLLGLIAALGGEPDEADAEELDALTAALDDGIEMIIDLDGGKLYFRGSLFALAYGDREARGDAWFSMDFGALGMEAFSALAELTQKNYTIGEFVYLLTRYKALEPVYLVESLAEAEAELAFLGDNHFTKRGNVWHYEEALPGLDGEGSGSVRMDVAVKDGVATGVKGSLSYDVENSWYAIGSAAHLSCDFDLSPLNASLSGSFHMKNVCLVEFSLTAESKATPGTEVPSAPPAGAEVIDLFASLLGSSVGIIGGADGPAAIWVA